MATEIEMPPSTTQESEGDPKHDASMTSMMASIKAALQPPDQKDVKPPEEAKKQAEEKKPEQVKKPETDKKQPEPAEKQDESKVVDDAPAETKPGTKVSGIEQVRRQYEATKAEKLKLEEEIKALKSAKPPEVSIEEIDKLKREKDELSAIVKRSDRQRHPEFRKEFVEPLDNLIKKARQYVPSESHGAIEALLRSPVSENRLSALESIVDSLSPARQSEIMRLADSAQDILERRESALSEADGWWKEQQQREADQARDRWKRTKEEFDQEFESVQREAADAIDLFKLRDGDEDHNRLVTKRIDMAKALLQGDSSRRRLVESAFAAVAAQEAIPLLARSRDEISKLEETIAAKDKELEELRSKRPSLSPTIKAEGKRPDMMDAIKGVLNVK